MNHYLINNKGPYEGTLDIDTEIIEAYSLSAGHRELDKKWFDVDANGHFHSYSIYDKDKPLPTLYIETQEKTYFCSDCREEHLEITSNYHCVICKVVVTPKYEFVRDSAISHIPGKTTITLTLHSYIHLLRDVPVTFQNGPYFGIARLTDYKRNGEKTYTILYCEVLAQRPFDDLREL